MKCPVCKEPNLVMADRQGIEVDYCPQCRGIWLDRGELDKIIERSGDRLDRSDRSDRPPDRRLNDRQLDDRQTDCDNDDHHRDRRRRDDDDDHYDPKHRKKRGSWLGELFDFD